MRIFGRLTIVAALALTAVGAAQAQQEGTLRIGTEGAYPPFNYTTAGGELAGFDIDIARALCERMEVECEFVTQDWDGIIPGLLAGRYDAIIASMSITEERQAVVDFTDRYYTNSLVFVAHENAGIADVSPEALAGRALGAQSATISAAHLEDNFGASTLRLYPTQEDAYRDLAAGRLDAVLADFGVTYLWLHDTDEGQCCGFVGEPVVSDDEIGIAVRKGEDELRQAFNEALAAIRADGTYQAINDRYFDFSVY
ncbi:MAG TPA: ABC transporter substrate-binding protein [Afifellaceae bacterium]|nr:ABC transporter substrate-binding protein [Afifellaceae bacterium]